MACDFRWPEVHGNLLLLGFSLVNARKCGRIQVLQIGAYDGLTCDPLVELLQHECVDAVLVEPQTRPYESLLKHYADNPRIRIINAAVGEFDGNVTLYVPSGEASPKASLINQHYHRFGMKAGEVREVSVASISVASLVKHCQVQDIDILQLDTEGMDYHILRLFFAAGVKPDVINFESLHLDKNERQACRELLRENRYWWIDTDQDTFAFKKTLVTIPN